MVQSLLFHTLEHKQIAKRAAKVSPNKCCDKNTRLFGDCHGDYQIFKENEKAIPFSFSKIRPELHKKIHKNI